MGGLIAGVLVMAAAVLLGWLLFARCGEEERIAVLVEPATVAAGDTYRVFAEVGADWGCGLAATYPGVRSKREGRSTFGDGRHMWTLRVPRATKPGEVSITVSCARAGDAYGVRVVAGDRAGAVSTGGVAESLSCSYEP